MNLKPCLYFIKYKHILQKMGSNISRIKDFYYLPTAEELIIISSGGSFYSCKYAINIDKSWVCADSTTLKLATKETFDKYYMTSNGFLVSDALDLNIKMTKYCNIYDLSEIDFVFKMPECTIICSQLNKYYLLIGKILPFKKSLLCDTPPVNFSEANVITNYIKQKSLHLFKFKNANLLTDLSLSDGEFIILHSRTDAALLALHGNMYSINKNCHNLIFTKGKLHEIIDKKLIEIMPLHDTVIPSYTLITEKPTYAYVNDKGTDISIGATTFLLGTKNVRLVNFAIYIDEVRYYYYNTLLYNDVGFAINATCKKIIYTQD